MKDLDFDSPKNKEKSLSDFKDLIKHPGWLLVKAIVSANILVLEDQINTGTKDETLESINRLRDKRDAYKNIIGTPEFWIKKLTPEDPLEQRDDDPYESVAKQTDL